MRIIKPRVEEISSSCATACERPASRHRRDGESCSRAARANSSACPTARRVLQGQVASGVRSASRDCRSRQGPGLFGGGGHARLPAGGSRGILRAALGNRVPGDRHRRRLCFASGALDLRQFLSVQAAVPTDRRCGSQAYQAATRLLPRSEAWSVPPAAARQPLLFSSANSESAGRALSGQEATRGQQGHGDQSASSGYPGTQAHITVFGVGGAGGNAVNNMIESGLQGVEFVVANTDAQALTSSKSQRVIQMGVQVTEGLAPAPSRKSGARRPRRHGRDPRSALRLAHGVHHRGNGRRHRHGRRARRLARRESSGS